ncbi:MAG: metal ABC transporter ATP-binding protein [Eubacteriales bacterium]|nr:metal ABC transporter ATP-binding protein [Eubacteriales bacterium]
MTQIDKKVPALHIENLTMVYREEPVLWDVHVDFPQGQISAIIGPNGAGKSTLIKGAMGLLKPLSGHVEFLGKAFKEQYKNIAYVSQARDVNWDFPTTVLDVALMGRYSQLGWIRRPKASDKELAEAALDRMGLLSMANRQISELSGGQRQRVFLARALCQEAEILILDEPLQGVDKKTEGLIMQILDELGSQGKSIIVVHHDLNTVEAYFEHVVMLNRVLVADGPVDTTFTKGNIEKAYGKTLSTRKRETGTSTEPTQKEA